MYYCWFVFLLKNSYGFELICHPSHSDFRIRTKFWESPMNFWLVDFILHTTNIYTWPMKNHEKAWILQRATYCWNDCNTDNFIPLHAQLPSCGADVQALTLLPLWNILYHFIPKVFQIPLKHFIPHIEVTTQYESHTGVVHAFVPGTCSRTSEMAKNVLPSSWAAV